MSKIVAHNLLFILWEYKKEDTQLWDNRGGVHEKFDDGSDQLLELEELPIDDL